MNDSFVALDAISHTFANGFQVVADISLTMAAGEFVALVGRSGVGKSTLLRFMAGLMVPTQGDVRLHGRLAHETKDPVGLLFQKDNLLPWRTVYDNVRLPLEVQGQRRAQTHDRVMALLQMVHLADYHGHYPAQLSGGMAQRVALARALVHEPSLLLLDEPFGALDAMTRETMGQELLRIWSLLPVTVCMVTHSIPEAVLLADRVLVLSGQPGRVVTDMRIELPRPRTLEMEGSRAFYAYAAALRAAIR